jgi:prepilin-type N-terminal cleavage/methylation domain-containing protein
MAEKMNKIQYRSFQNGVSLIELILILAIIGILAVIAITNYISYRDKAYCYKAEDDAQKILAALSAYFSDPEHKLIPTIDELKNSQNLLLNNNNEISYFSTGSNWAIISVGDDNDRCPYDKENKKYFVYFGTAGTSGWK